MKEKLKLSRIIICMIMTATMLLGSSIMSFAEGNNSTWDKTGVLVMDIYGKQKQFPSDYTGIGYFMKMHYNAEPEFYDKNKMVAFGNVRTYLETRDGKSYFGIKGVWEMDPSRVFSGHGKDNIIRDLKNIVPDYKNSFEYKMESNSDGLVKIIDKDLFDRYNGAYSCTSIKYGLQDYSVNYAKPMDGSIVNQLTDTGWTIDPPSKDHTYNPVDNKDFEGYFGSLVFDYKGPSQFPLVISVDENKDDIYLDNFTINVPTSNTDIWTYPVENWCGEFKYETEIPYNKYGKVDSVVVKKVLSSDVRMYCKADAEFETTYIPFVDEAYIIDKEVKGDDTVYTVRLKTNAPFDGHYSFKFNYRMPNDAYVHSVTSNNVYVRESLSNPEYSKREVVEVKVTVPSNAVDGYFHLVGINSLRGSDSFSSYNDDKDYGNIPYIGFDIYNVKNDVTVNSYGVSSKTSLDYHVSVKGDYKAVYSYLEKGDNPLSSERRTVTCDVKLDKSKGNIYFNSPALPVDALVIYFEGLVSPDGVSESASQLIYRASDYMPTPTEFSAEVNGQKVSGSPGSLYLEVIVDYASPNTHRYNLVMEYEKDEVKKTIEKDFSAKVGYYASGWMNSSNANDVLKYEGNPLVFDAEVPYVKLLRIEDKDSGEIIKYDQYLYCKHFYDSDCDADCNICHASRTVGDHLFENKCDSECNNCKYKREVPDHDYGPRCNDTCRECGNKREVLGCEYYYAIEKPLSCTEQGEIVIKCRYCGNVYGERIIVKPIGHIYNDEYSYDDTYHWIEAVCDHKDLVKDKAKHTFENECDDTCDDCEYVRTVEGHYYEYECDTECWYCGEKREAPDHEYVVKVLESPTCRSIGTGVMACKYCGLPDGDAFDLPPVDHSFDDDCDTTCNNAKCNYTRVAPHHYEFECDDQCWDCGEPRESAGHKYVAVNKVNPTCVKTGIAQMECEYCRTSNGEDAFDVAPLGHLYKEVIDKPATATEDGSKHEECTRCKDKKDSVVIPAGTTPGVTPDDNGGKNPSSNDNNQTITPSNGSNDSNDGTETNLELGQDGTALGTGASVNAANKAILAAKSDEGPAGTTFGKLQLRTKKTTKNSITITWKKISGCKYIVYGNKCGSEYKKLGTVSKNTFTQKKLKKGKYYKYLVVAVKNGKVVSSAKTLHVATKGGKVGNYKKVTVNKTKVTLKKGKTFKIKAKQIAESKKLKVMNHRAVKYESSNKKVVTVSSKGKIKAVGKGTATVYVYTQSGVFAKIKVRVN